MKSKTRLKKSRHGSLDEVEGLLKYYPGIDEERVWKEVQKHRSTESEKLELDELDAVSGEAYRDWQKDGCVASCEQFSWCGSNDQCVFFDITYDNFWAACPDGHEHVFDGDKCVHCGYVQSIFYSHQRWRNQLVCDPLFSPK